MAQFLGHPATGIATRNLLAHIRHATSGAVQLSNVHPFSREMWGIPWCFGHNGQIPLFDDHADFVLGQHLDDHHDDHDDNKKQQQHKQQQRIYTPVGTTDSEAAFCAILNALRAKFTDTMPSLPILYDELKRLCDEIVRYDPQGTIFNFMLTCGPHLLWVYSWPGQRPGSKVWNGVYYTLRNTNNNGGGGTVQDDDNNNTEDYDETLSIPDDLETYTVNLHHHHHRHHKSIHDDDDDDDSTKIDTDDDDSSTSSSSSGPVCLVATKPLTKDEEWIELERGELLVLDEGIPRVSVMDLFRVELQGHGLYCGDGDDDRACILPPPRLEEDMRRYHFDPAYFSGGGI